MWRCSHLRTGAGRAVRSRHPDRVRRPWPTDRSASTTRPTATAPVPVVVDPALGPIVAPWRAPPRAVPRGGARVSDAADWDHAHALRRLVGARGRRPPRHRRRLLAGARWPRPATATPPTTLLAGFDPSSSPDEFVAGDDRGDVRRRAARSPRRRARRAGRAALRVSTTTRGTDGASRRSVTSRRGSILAHGYWDSWLHEYDVFVRARRRARRRRRRPARRDRGSASASPGSRAGSSTIPTRSARVPTAPIDVCLAFSDLPGCAFHLSVGTLADGVRVGAVPARSRAGRRGPRASTSSRGSTGRRPDRPRPPPACRAAVARAGATRASQTSSDRPRSTRRRSADGRATLSRPGTLSRRIAWRRLGERGWLRSSAARCRRRSRRWPCWRWPGIGARPRCRRPPTTGPPAVIGCDQAADPRRGHGELRARPVVHLHRRVRHHRVRRHARLPRRPHPEGHGRQPRRHPRRRPRPTSTWRT